MEEYNFNLLYSSFNTRIKLYKNTLTCKYTLSLMFCSQEMVLSRQQLHILIDESNFCNRGILTKINITVKLTEYIIYSGYKFHF